MKISVNLRNFLTVLFKYKSSIIAVWATTVLVILFGNELVVPMYESESPIMINFGREYLYQPEVGKQAPYNYYDRSGLINAEIEILSSHDLIETIVTKIGIDNLYPIASPGRAGTFIDLTREKIKTLINRFNFRTTIDAGRDARIERAIQEYNKHLTILGSKESNVIRVIFQHPDPAMAARVVNLHLEEYQKKHLDMFRDKRVTSFLENMVNKYRYNLDESGKKLEQYKKQYPALSLDLQEEILIRQRGKFDTLLKNNIIEEKATGNRLKSLEDQLSKMSESAAIFSETAEQDRVIDNTKAILLSLKLKEDELKNVYREESSEIQNIRHRITLVEQFLKEQKSDRQATVRMGKSQLYQDIEQEIAVTRADLAQLKSKSITIAEKVESIDADLTKHKTAEHKLRILLREYKINEDNYLAYVDKLEESRINAEMDNQVMTNIRLVYKAIAPVKPIKPRKILNLLVGFFLGGVAGFSLAFYRNYLNQGINVPEDVERLLGCQVLATINHKNA